MPELVFKDVFMYIFSGTGLFIVFYFFSMFFLCLIDFFVYIPRDKEKKKYV